MKGEITFWTAGSYIVGQGVGGLTFLAALIPSVIVASQWLSTGKASAGIGSLIPGVAVMLWGLKIMTERVSVTVNADQGTLVWKHFVYGRNWKTVTWPRDQIEAIETIGSSGIIYATSGYTFYVRGTPGRVTLLNSTQDKLSDPIRDTARMLNIPVEPLPAKV